MAENHNSNFSDEDEDSDTGFNQAEFQGTLSKWTNYIHGWQRRFIVLQDGTLSYFKSQEDSGFGCRGAISLFKATIRPHEFDECRFDISVNDSTWYLRADTAEDRKHWVEVLESFKAESAYGSESSLKRHGSTISLQSTTLSSASSSSFKRNRGLKEKLAEIETFREILNRQMETLQKYFDKCAEVASGKTHDELLINGTPTIDPDSVDFKGEAITFKATTSAVIATLQHCLDLFTQKEEYWKKKLDKEADKRKKMEELYHAIKQEMNLEKTKVKADGGPDLEEGPHTKLNEEEFFDAVETSLDKIEEDEELREKLKNKKTVVSRPDKLLKNHPLWEEIEKITNEQLHYALQEVGTDTSDWHIFAQEGDMKLYKREVMVDGLVMDPLKACHVVKGVTGHEMSHYFFDPSYRHESDTTVENMSILEKVDASTMIFYQLHKHIWPAAQRDSLFWSHVRTVSNPLDSEGQDIWCVTNHSTDHKDFPANVGKTIRVIVTVCLVCQTFVDPPTDGTQITRDNIRCKIIYCSVVNPGGWAPAAALRHVYKREYPKFVKRFTAFVQGQCKDKPIMF